MSRSELRRFNHVKVSNPADVRALAPDHPAIVEARTLFPTTVVAQQDQKRLLVSGHNNRKIGKEVVKGPWKGLPIYTLTLEERATCPRSCFMYAECYGNAMHMARRNQHGELFEGALIGELLEKQVEHPDGFVVRLHVLGDFYSVAYVNLWNDMLETCAGLRIFGYTARDRRDDEIGAAVDAMNERHKGRCVIRFSSEAGALPMGATVIDRVPDKNTVDEGFVCPAETSDTECCATCGLCWAESHLGKTVVFIKHGMGASESRAAAATVNAKTANDGLRPVAPMSLAGLASSPVEGRVVGFREVAPTALVVDETYQRRMSAKGARLVRAIASQWSWRKFNPPTVNEVGDGTYHVIDGQHTAIAAASRSDIDKIWVKVVDADKVEERAATFVGINRDRVAVTNQEVFYAELAAGDADARAIKDMCDRAGIIILRQPPAANRYSPGECMAVMTLRRLYRRRGARDGEAVLKACVQAGLAPVKDWGIEAVQSLMFTDKDGPKLTGAAIVTAIRAAGPQLGALAHGWQVKTGLRMPDCYAHVIRRYAK